METKHNAIEIKATPEELKEMGWTAEEYDSAMSELEKASEEHIRAKTLRGLAEYDAEAGGQ